MRCIDLFAGLGGFTLGATWAGARVVWAANHWPLAVQVHRARHPEVEHACQDLRQADWSTVPEHDLLLASPACQGHSTASQGKRRPKHDADRATAWAVVSAAEYHRPPWLLVENVPAFRRWQLFDLWLEALRRLGYAVTVQELDAADFGVPQNRRRLFICGHLGVSAFALRPPILGLHVPARSILQDGAQGWRSIRQASPGAQRRIARGRQRCGPRFLTQHVTNHPGRELSRPIGTITTANAHWWLVDGGMARPLGLGELLAAQGFPADHPMPGVGTANGTRLIGNAVPPPMAQVLIEQIGAAA